MTRDAWTGLRLLLALTAVTALVVTGGACGSAKKRAKTQPSPPSGGSSAAGTASEQATRSAAASDGFPTPGTSHQTPPALDRITSWVYQLQGYERGRLDALGRAPQQLAVIDLTRDGHADYFTAAEVDALRRSGKRVLAYFEIGSIENYRPEFATLPQDLRLNRWADWPEEFFVRYWDARWWDRVVRPRVDQALWAGFDGVYLDTPLAYEELDLALVPGYSRNSLAAAMVQLIVRISTYAKSRRPGFWIVPQNSPELRLHGSGYIDSIDGVGMEELFFQATDTPCRADYCQENLDHTRALRDAGKLVLAVDYAVRPENLRAACARYRAERFAGYVGVRDLDRISPPCG